MFQAFFCCYLLTSLSPKHVNHTYIGFTKDPARRIRQHNGEIEGGAFKTSKKRPWQMVLLVHGFPSQVAALRFEWAWQNPQISLTTREAMKAVEGVGRPDHIRAKLRTLFEMTRVPPFSRFPLCINFFTQLYHKYLEGCPLTPSHMPTTYQQHDQLYL